MNFLNKQVMHKEFGKGSVVELSKSRVEIHFPIGNKRFVFPDAFGTHLTMIDKRAAELVKKMKIKREAEKKTEEQIREKERKKRYEEQQRIQTRKKILKNLKIHSSSQVAFWCEGEEQDKVFKDWEVFIGEIMSGQRKGQVKKLVRLHQNSAVIFTTRDSDMAEENRYISGIYMVKEGFIGKMCEDGIIRAHSEYRLKLSEEESQKILFWNYYEDNRNSNKMTWNAGKSRYLNNIWLAQILRDIVSLKKDSKEKDKAQKFYNYYCEMNQIKQSSLPKPNGVLMQSVS
ncbi:MAG TPA: malate synthase [Clostridiales bacterium]|nr:malate synthase [Clostridia bacterium]MDD4680858.1 malate synthase [Clostridia bacterium]HCS73338.1 malate synthase [Clostridiales bacterium]